MDKEEYLLNEFPECCHKISAWFFSGHCTCQWCTFFECGKLIIAHYTSLSIEQSKDILDRIGSDMFSEDIILKNKQHTFNYIKKICDDLPIYQILIIYTIYKKLYGLIEFN